MPCDITHVVLAHSDSQTNLHFENPAKRHSTKISAHPDDIHLDVENIGPALEALQGFFATASSQKAHQM